MSFLKRAATIVLITSSLAVGNSYADLVLEFSDRGLTTIEADSSPKDPDDHSDRKYIHPREILEDAFARFAVGFNISQQNQDNYKAYQFGSIGTGYVYIPPIMNSMVLFGEAGLNFNMFSYSPDQGNLRAGFRSRGNLFAGAAIGAAQNPGGAHILFGASGFGEGKSAGDESGTNRSYIYGIESGLLIEQPGVTTSLTAGVGGGRVYCSVDIPNGPTISLNNRIRHYEEDRRAVFGVARLLVGDNVYMNILYAHYPASRFDYEPVVANAIHGTVFWEIGDTITLQGNCALKSIKSGKATTVTEMKNADFTIGILKRIGSRKKR